MTERTSAASSPGAIADERTHSPLRGLLARQEVGVFLILMVMCVFLAITTDTFLTVRNITTVVLFFSWIAIAAFGETMVILTAGIDLSVGSVMALTGLAAAWLLTWEPLASALPVGLLVLVGLAGGLLVGLTVGAVNGGLIARFRLPPFIATLGTLSIARGIAYGWSRGQPIRNLPQQFKDIGQATLDIGPLSLPLPILYMLIIFVVVSVFLSETIVGRHIYAVGGNEEAVRVSGVNPNRVKMLVYVLGGLLAGVAGLVNTAKLGVAAPTAAAGWELDIIAAVVIGGTSLFGGSGTVLGTLFGAAIMGVLRNGLNLLGFPAYWQPAAIGAVIILAVMLDQWRLSRQ